jgi:amino acid transporter
MKTYINYTIAIGAAIFLSLIVVLAIIAPQVNPLTQGISFYALTQYRIVIELGLFIVGFIGILLAFTLWEPEGPLLRKSGCSLLILWGISSIAAGIFPVDPPDIEQTVSGAIHNLAGLNFLLVAIAVPLIDRSRSKTVIPPEQNPRQTLLTWSTVLSAILLFLFNGPLVTLGVGGLFQRIYWLSLCLWILVKARNLLRIEKITKGSRVQAP